MSGDGDVADVVVIGTAVPELLAALCRTGFTDVTQLAGDEVSSAEFVGGEDRWLVVTRGGDQHTVRIVVQSGSPSGADVVGRWSTDDVRDARSRFGVHRYHGVARHGFPNFFTVADRRGTDHAVACLAAMRDRGCTRIEVKAHVQAQYSRNIDAGLERLNEKPGLADYEFTRVADRVDDDDEFRGPAVLIDADGAEVAVEVRLLALFQPVDNAVRWSGRVQPSPALAGLHRWVNQPVTLRIGDHRPVDAVLVDHDPWGGSHIVGEGTSPYPLPLAAQLARLDAC